MKSRKSTSGKSHATDLAPGTSHKSPESADRPAQTGGGAEETQHGPAIAPHADAQAASGVARILEQLTSEPGTTLFIAHPLTPERQKMLAEVFLADVRKEAFDAIQKLRTEIEGIEKSLTERTTDVARLNDDLSNVLAAVNMPVIIVGKDLRLIRSSPAAVEVLNIVPDRVGHTLTSADLTVRIPELQDVVSKVVASGEVMQYDVSDNLGRWFHLQIGPYTTGDGRAEGAVLILRDIDEQKRNEGILRSYRDREHGYLDISTGMLLGLDAIGTVVAVNRAGCDLLGVGATEVIGKRWFETFVAKTHAAAAKSLFEKIVMGEHPEECEYPIVNKAGEERLISWRYVVQRDNADTVSGTIWSGEDRTSFQQARAALAQSEERMRLVMETAGEDQFFITDQEGYVVHWMGRPDPGKSYGAEEMVGQHYSRLFPSDEFQSGRPMRILENAEKDGRYEATDWRVRKDGSKVKAYVMVIPVRDNAGKLTGFSHATRYLVNAPRRRDSIETSFADLHGYPLREEQ